MSAEHDLLYSLLDFEAEPRRYPWDPAAPESDAYFLQAEAEWDDGAVDESLARGWTALSQQLSSRWEGVTAPSLSVAEYLQQQFSSRMPNDLLQRLAGAAVDLAQSGQPLIDQLVDCVHVVLSDWQRDDLAVLARPLAFSLRDGRSEILDLHLKSLRQTDWDSLSGLEQARLSLTLASVALTQADAALGDETAPAPNPERPAD